jgi:hypothetical protein
MRIWRMLAAVAMVLFASQAIAENWVVVAADPDEGSSINVDKDSIRRGGDGLVYFNEESDASYAAEAADCPKRVLYTLNMDLVIGKHLDFPNWRSDGKAVEPKSWGEAELQYVCANSGKAPY